MNQPAADKPDGTAKRGRLRLLRGLPLALGPVVLVVILLKLDVTALLDSLRVARATLLLAATAIMLPTVFLRTIRWRLLLRDAGAPSMRFHQTLRVGELVKTYHLTRGGMILGGSTAAGVALSNLFFGITPFTGLSCALSLVSPAARSRV